MSVATKKALFLFLGIFMALLIIMVFPPFYGELIMKDLGIRSAYVITERLVLALNTVSAAPEDSYIIVELPRGECEINFYGRYVHTKTMFSYSKYSILPYQNMETFYGLFALSDFEAPDSIGCETERDKEIRVSKEGGVVSVAEVSG